MSATAGTPKLVLHQLPPSHPCATVRRALTLKGLEVERVDVTFGRHGEEMAAIYGEGRTTVPGMLVDDEPVHGTVAILRRLDRIRPDVAPLYPAPIADAVRDAEAWADGELQDLGRRLPWGALHFRPERFGALLGRGTLDGAGTDVAIRAIRGGWRYHGITAERLQADLAGLPAILAQVDRYVDEGLMGGEAPTALDLHVGATIRVLAMAEDLRPLLRGTRAWEHAQRWFPIGESSVPAGAYPEGWVPAATAPQ
ncbi:MAG: glutathione S-transferase N-terminal domain-containing protein [Solirubrobacteraceae bacterium]|nr:glutathione S-transferase N-terminal domain-containing protein [Solirubrobacteraceae bacterium]